MSKGVLGADGLSIFLLLLERPSFIVGSDCGWFAHLVVCCWETITVRDRYHDSYSPEDVTAVLYSVLVGRTLNGQAMLFCSA